MIYLATILLTIPLLIGLTFALWIAEHYVERLPGNLHWTAKAALLPWMWLGFGLDVLLNATVAWIAFLARPRELTFSARLTRHMHEGGWRARLATSICMGWLRPVDEHHCE